MINDMLRPIDFTILFFQEEFRHCRTEKNFLFPIKKIGLSIQKGISHYFLINTSFFFF